MKKFHKAMQLCIYQCTICHEAWPLKTEPKEVSKYVCSRCSHDKNIPKKFSVENSMIPSPVPKQLQGLTQFELLEHSQSCMYIQNQGVVKKHTNVMR